VGQIEFKLCSGNQIANGQTDRQTDARGYNIICPFGHIKKKLQKCKKKKAFKIKKRIILRKG
jgi:hypothetical protein